MKGTPRFPGICRRAKTLGVTHTHLFLVLTGQRKSTRLLERYNALVAAEKAAASAAVPGTRVTEGTIFAVGSRELHEQLVTENPDALRIHGDSLEALKEITLSRPLLFPAALSGSPQPDKADE